jgi:hypothetical protein
MLAAILFAMLSGLRGESTMHARRWARTGAIAVAWAVGAYAVPAGAETCGLGPPPGAPGFAEARAREAAEVKRDGFLRVCAANLARYHIVFRAERVADARLAFAPLDLARTPFATFATLGLDVEEIVGIRSRLYRGFRMPDGHVLTLSEQDMSADGTSMTRAPEDEPERINGLPARLTVLQGPGGAAVSHLSWVEGRRMLELWIDANVAHSPLRDRLFALAASLPRSVPACPNGPPPRPVRLGPDGFPEDEPPPVVLSQAQMAALVDRARRPCR